MERAPQSLMEVTDDDWRWSLTRPGAQPMSEIQNLRKSAKSAPPDCDPGAASLITLLPYQKRWLADRARFKIAMVARQCGKTKYMAAPEVIEDCLEHEARVATGAVATGAGARARWIFLSRGERQALEAMEEGLKPLARMYQAAFEAVEYDFLGASGVRYKAAEIIFPHGSRITALPSNPDTARGFTANVVLDEFAFHQDSRKIWAALFPVISRPGLKLRVLSTPNGKDNKFYDLMTAKQNPQPLAHARGSDRREQAVIAAASSGPVWSRYVIDIYQAVREGLERDVDELREACGDPDLWQQEYELKWLDEASAWLGYELIEAVEDAEAGKPELYRGGFCFAGNDIGARHDLWVFWVWELVDGVLWTREIRELRRVSFAEQEGNMAELMARYRIARVAMDQSGMGEKPAEDARRRWPGKVEGVLFTAQSKLALAVSGKAAFEQRKVRIPAGNAALRSDLHKLRKISGPTGIPRFVAERDENHADRTWAAFLGIAAADAGKHPEPKIW